ncbi:MAG TPA: hypothetical protein VMH87_18075 [Pseudomonadales bacterium]|nr:hypothetical protein [Pseudomonadales bacterium]
MKLRFFQAEQTNFFLGFCIPFLLASLLFGVGCSTPTQSQRMLYQSYTTTLGEECLTIHLLDQGEPQKAREFATMQLTFSLDALQKNQHCADKDQLATVNDLVHLILKNADEHREQLAQDKYSLQMVIECKSLVTNTVDIQRASDLAKFLSATCTNQIVYTKP